VGETGVFSSLARFSAVKCLRRQPAPEFPSKDWVVAKARISVEKLSGRRSSVDDHF